MSSGVISWAHMPHTNGVSLLRDLSAHAETLVEQYRIEDGLHRAALSKFSVAIRFPHQVVKTVATNPTGSWATEHVEEYNGDQRPGQ